MILLSLASKCLTSAQNVNLKHKAIELLLSPCICFDCAWYGNGSKSSLVIPCKRTEKEPVSLQPEILGGVWIRQHLLSQGTPNNSVKYDLPAQSQADNSKYSPTYTQYLLLVPSDLFSSLPP